MKAFIANQSGAIAVMLALVMTSILAFLGLGIEAGLWYATQRDMQAIADAAAIGGAYQMMLSTPQSAREAALADAARNGFVHGVGGRSVAIYTPPITGAYQGEDKAIEVVLSQPTPSLLSRLITGPTIEISARSVALAGPPGDYCVVALDSLVAGALGLNGSATVDVGGCGLAANSMNNSAFTMTGNSVLKAQFLELVGNLSVSGGAMLTLDQPVRTGRPPIADPYQDLTMPPVGSCDYTNLRVSGTKTLTPGTYCGGLTINSGAIVTLQPGIYVLNGGRFKINGGATVNGQGVTFLLNGSGSSYTDMDIAGGAIVTISAPTSGPWAGMAFFQSPNAPTGVVNKFLGGAGMEITGILYFPRQEVQFTGGNSADGGCLRVVAREVGFSGNADIDNVCGDKGVPMVRYVRPDLVE